MAVMPRAASADRKLFDRSGRHVDRCTVLLENLSGWTSGLFEGCMYIHLVDTSSLIINRRAHLG